ncbi:MAG: SHOCT domain-containing protein, partial [Oscillospiraceae bacterium]|nr:SHOCT domain-containing protein [Oscillospiraceae bacterium]
AKTYDEMSSNEQLLVRYKYFLEQTALAQDDFAKTSEGWANQTRLLSERINEFMTNLGSVIMNVLTPALQFANEAVTFLNDLFFGGNDNVEDTTAAKNAEAITDEVTSMGTAADKSKKKLNNLLSGFDELHIISGAGSDKDKENTTDAGIDTSNLLGVNLDADTSSAKKAAQKYRDIINEIYLAFKRHPLTKAIEDIIKGIGKFFGFIGDNSDIPSKGIVDALMDILGAIIAYKTITTVVRGVNTFSKGFNGLISLITAHPTAAAVAGITALAIGILALNDEMQRQRIASYFGDISISLDEVRTLINPITESVDKVASSFKDNETKLTTAKENFSDIAKAVQETADSFKKNDIEQDVESFATQLDELVNSALEVNSATFDTSAWQIAFLEDDGKIDEREQEILNSFTEMGESIADKIKGYGKAIHLITQKAIDENRELTQAEIENLEDLYKKLAEMTLVQTQVESEATWERLKRGAYSIDSYEELAAQIKEAQEQEKKARDELQQSMYKDVLAKLGSERAAGEITDEEFERQKAELFKEVDDTVKELDIKSARYQREILTTWAHTAFDRIVDSNQGYSAEMKKKVKEFFDLKINTPKGVDLAAIFKNTDPQTSKHLNWLMNYNLDELNRQFGVDFMYEWRNLNEAIGDTGASLDEFYDSLEYFLKNVEGLDVDDLFPKMDELKESPKEFAEALSEWIDKTNFDPIKIPVELDTTEAYKWLDEYIAKYSNGGNGIPQQSLSPTPSSYASQAPYAVGMQPVQQEFTFPIVIDGVTTETVKTNTETVLRPDWGDLMTNNGWGR